MAYATHCVPCACTPRLEVEACRPHPDVSGGDIVCRHCVPLRDWFDYRGHVCMVFQRLGPSLFDFLRRNNYRPFPIDLVQQFSRQMLEAVEYMHALHLVHTDLKPENILLESLETSRASSSSGDLTVPSTPAIKVIDFGSSTFEEQYHSNIVSTRHYRAPEIILGHGWSYPCDMWSIGCIMVELITGDALFQVRQQGCCVMAGRVDSNTIWMASFHACHKTCMCCVGSWAGGDVPQGHVPFVLASCILLSNAIRCIVAATFALEQTHENLEHLAMMEAVLGPIPEGLATRAEKTFPKFFQRGRLRWPAGAASKKSARVCVCVCGGGSGGVYSCMLLAVRALLLWLFYLSCVCTC